MTSSMKIKVLIADDDEIYRKVLEKRLSCESLEIYSASSGPELLTTAFAVKPDIILLDILLGQDYGPTVYDELISQGFDRNIPVIILSSLAEDEPPSHIPKGRKIIMHHKCISPEKLLEEIFSLVAPHQQN